MVDSPTNIINIQLGDILEIMAPENVNFNSKQFWVKYINSEKIILIDLDNSQTTTIQLDQSGQLEDKTIDGFNLLSRASFPGYAKQNDLEPGKWIDIYFGGDTPFIIT